MTTIGIIDYGMGNLRSVQKAIQSVGGEAVILRSADKIKQIDKLILPGVGAFADGMEHLQRMGWIDPLRQWIESGRPFLGICLGMQLLFDYSQEGDVAGLCILSGQVVRFDEIRGGERIKVPHMGWNTLTWTRNDPLLSELPTQELPPEAIPLKPQDSSLNPPQLPEATTTPGTLLGTLPGAGAVYFVHAYYVEPADTSIISARADYGGPFCASIWRDNVWAMQFHPEKSQRVGLSILRQFAD